MSYVQIEKALHGMLRATLLFYRKLRADLEDMGLEANPYCMIHVWLTGVSIEASVQLYGMSMS